MGQELTIGMKTWQEAALIEEQNPFVIPYALLGIQRSTD